MSGRRMRLILPGNGGMALSSDGWDSAGSGASSWDDWGGGNAQPVTDPWGGGFEEIPWQAPRPTSLTLLLIGLASALLGLVIGVVALLTTNLAKDPLSGIVVGVVVLGWILSGAVSVLAVARYQSVDLRKATSAFYQPHPIAAALRLSVLAVGTLGVLFTSYVFATWLARH